MPRGPQAARAARRTRAHPPSAPAPASFRGDLGGAERGWSTSTTHTRERCCARVWPSEAGPFPALSRLCALVCACCFCCVDAIFVRTGTVLPGIDGREWRADKEFSFSLFRRALKGMRGGKAVGLTGFSVELLRVFDQAGKGESEVLRLMYEAIMLASLRKLRGWEVDFDLKAGRRARTGCGR